MYPLVLTETRLPTQDDIYQTLKMKFYQASETNYDCKSLRVSDGNDTIDTKDLKSSWTSVPELAATEDSPKREVSSTTVTFTSLKDLQEAKYGAHNHSAWPSCLYTGKDSYLIVLKSDEDGCSQKDRDAHLQKVLDICNNNGDPRYGIQLGPKDLSNLYPGYMGLFPPDVIEQIKDCKEVDYIKSNCLLGSPASVSDWAQAKATLDFDEYYRLLFNEDPDWVRKDDNSTKGIGVHIFVFDTDGFKSTDFEGSTDFLGKPRVKVQPGREVIDFRVDEDDEEAKKRCHGTCVANIAAGNTFGLASKAAVYPFCNSLRPLYLAKAIDVAIQEYRKVLETQTDPKPLGLLNCSFEYFSNDYDLAKELTKVEEAGIRVIIASGNDSKDMNVNVSHLFNAVPRGNFVGALDMSGNIASFSNYGRNVSIYLPGEGLRVFPDRLNYYTEGTSYAAPFLAGLLACAWGDNLLQNYRKIHNGLQLLEDIQDSLTMVTCLYKTGSTESQLLPLQTIGPSATIQDLVIWHLPVLVKEGDQWKRERGDRWSIRAKCFHKNITKIITTEELRRFAVLLTDESKDQRAEFEKFWTKSLGFDWEDVSSPFYKRIFIQKFKRESNVSLLDLCVERGEKGLSQEGRILVEQRKQIGEWILDRIRWFTEDYPCPDQGRVVSYDEKTYG